MNPHSLSKGLMMALTTILIYMAIYFVNSDLLASMSLGFMAYIIYIVFMTLAAKATKAENGGFLSFGEGFSSSWLSYVVGGLIITLFMYVLYNYIDPSLIDTIKEKQLEMVERFAGSLSEADRDKMIEEMDKKNPFGLGTVAIGYVVSLIIAAIVAAIIAAIMKKEDNNEFA